MKNQLEPRDDDKKFKDERTDKRVHEILSDENAEVSEQDISNIITDEAITGGNNNAAADDAEPVKERKIRDDEDPEIDTTWNIAEGGN